MQANPNICPFTGKIMHKTARSARGHKRFLERTYGGLFTIYNCRCGCKHVGHMVARHNRIDAALGWAA